MENSNNEFRTTDTSLAAYLTHEGFTLFIIEYVSLPSGKRRGTFVFDGSTPKFHDYVSLYNKGDATINLALYEHAKSRLLDRIMKGLP